eukprot:scaffold34.g4508.t1
MAEQVLKFTKMGAAAPGAWTLAHPSGEVAGKITVYTRGTYTRADITSGYGGRGGVAQAAGLQVGDDIEFTLDLAARRITVAILSRGNEIQPRLKHPEAIARQAQRVAERVAKEAEKQHRRQERELQRAEKQQQRAEKKRGQSGGKRKRRPAEDGAGPAEAEAGEAQEQVAAAGQGEGNHGAARDSAGAAPSHGRQQEQPEEEQQGEGAEQEQEQAGQEQEQEQEEEQEEGQEEQAGQERQQAEEQQQEQQHDEHPLSASEPAAKRRKRGRPPGKRAAAAAGAGQAVAAAAAAPKRHRAAAPAAAVVNSGDLVGQEVIALDKVSQRWCVGRVDMQAPDGALIVSVPAGSEECRRMSADDVVAALRRPGCLLGATEFSAGVFSGQVTQHDHLGRRWAYLVVYEDNDKEHLTEAEVLEVMHAPPPRSRVQQTGVVAVAAGSITPDLVASALEVATRAQRGRPGPGRPAGGLLQPTLTSGGRGGKARRLAQCGGGAEAPQENLAASWQAPDVEPAGEGMFAACGAGHARGVAAYDDCALRHCPADKDRCWRPEGATPERRTLCVPGWIGVRVEGDEHWTPEYEGRFVPVLWDSILANKQALPPCAACATPEDAARLYDKARAILFVRFSLFRGCGAIAVAYFGPELADTNYPVTAELLEELGPRTPGASRSTVTCALRLLVLEQSLPFEAVQEAALLPSARGALLKRFLAGCDSCEAIGSHKDHLYADMASCTICALNLKGSARGKNYHHSQTTLMALLQVAESCLLSQGALSALHGGEGEEAAEAAAQDEQGEMDRTVADSQARLGAGAGASEPEASAAAAARPRHQPRQPPRRPAAGAAALPARRAGGGAGGSALAGLAAPRRVEGLAAREPLPEGLRVVVIGGGVAGLKAAGELQRSGAEVTVVEARDRRARAPTPCCCAWLRLLALPPAAVAWGLHKLGGRIRTHVLEHEGIRRPVDLGATFVCGERRHTALRSLSRRSLVRLQPVARPLDQHTLSLRQFEGAGTSTEAPTNPMFRFTVGTLGLTLREGKDATVLLAAEEKYAHVHAVLLERGTEAGLRPIKAADRRSIADVVEEALAEMEITPDERDIVEAFCADLYVTTQDQLDLGGSVAEGYDGDHELVVGGFKQVVDALARGVAEDRAEPEMSLKDVRLGHEVTRVQLLEGGAGALVHLRDREPLRCHAVVCTLPLGVLQAGRVAFEPALPEYKAQVMERLGMGTENRVAMLFPKRFWPETPHFLRPVTGRYTYANMHALGLENVLCAWAVDAVEAMSREEAMGDVEAHLRKLFPDSYEPPLAYEVTYWKSDPYSCGAYSFVKLGGSKSCFERLSYPVTGVPALDRAVERDRGRARPVHWETRLYFAGEATHRGDAYTVHGAYESGTREARRICKWWRDFHGRVRQAEREAAAAAPSGGGAAQDSQGEAGGRVARAASVAARSRLAQAQDGQGCAAT